MRITNNTLQYFNEVGLNHIRQSIIKGLKKQLEQNGGEDEDFDNICGLYRHLEKYPRLLLEVVNELNTTDDMFGTEGWEHTFGLED